MKNIASITFLLPLRVYSLPRELIYRAVAYQRPSLLAPLLLGEDTDSKVTS
jgi:hypothetical protein